MWHCKQYSFFSKLGLYMFAQSPIAPKICTSKFLSFARTWGGGRGREEQGDREFQGGSRGAKIVSALAKRTSSSRGIRTPERGQRANDEKRMASRCAPRSSRHLALRHAERTPWTSNPVSSLALIFP